MGTCYSGLGSKSCAISQTPIDPKVRPTAAPKSSQIEDKLKDSDCHHLSSSFEVLSFESVNELNAKMSSQPVRKIPVPSAKTTVANNKVAPKRSEEFVLNKYKTRRYDAAVDVNKVMIFENSSTTSISSDCSLNLSKSSLKSTSSSTSIGGRPQTSIPTKMRGGKTSRTPTPPIPVNNVSNGNQRNKSLPNHSSLISDRLNGNETVKTDSKSYNKAKTMHTNEANILRQPREPSYGSSIKYTTQVSGLPRPQTAHIVSTSSHTTDNYNHKINTSNDMSTRGNHYSDQKSSNSRCDPNLRQIKPYFYGMNMNNKPYERPLPPAATNQYPSPPKPITNQPKLQFNSKFSHNNNQKLNLKYSHNSSTIATNNYQNSVRESSANQRIVSNNNQNRLNSHQTDRTAVKPDSNDPTNHKSFENTFLPKSTQRMKDLGPQFKRTPKNDKSLENSPEHNSMSSSVGANSEADNRDFLIDDEISDQPELVLSSNIDKKDLMKNLNLELEGLLLQQDTIGSPSTPTATTPISSTSSTTTITPNVTPKTTFRKPRPLSLVETPDGSLGLDSPSLRAASQDLIGIKTLLFRLHGLLQNAETLNPFEHNYTQNKLYHQLIAENESNDISVDLQTENIDLKRQIVLQQQIIEDKDRTIRLLQQQMAKYCDINNAYLPQTIDSCKVNASSQTERCANASNIDPRAVSDGSNGMLVSFWISKVPAYA